MLKNSIELTDYVIKAYVEDIDDSDMTQRPGQGCNHLAWQLGHLIQAEHGLLKMAGVEPGFELPAGFSEAHSKEAKDVDDRSAFLPKSKYLELYAAARAATKAAIEKLSDADLDKPGPPDFKMCPTVGAVFNMIATHPLMHAGQFVPIRRRLGKPVVI
jgi:hypothetical protein